ncbi:class I SAM-dependent methyltransferase [Nonomuraea typhae]|uniref:class I SAM-dependent methyltransferase n=1 Tax=Nonomuraea typhae TaxID=2603600 RepID=UPI0012FB6F29|nr:class I SAM-dependent methyltransferase [Nonomuraea typhae]
MNVKHPVFARFYIRLSRAMEHGGMRENRRLLLAPLRGRVLEIGAGNGLNFRHYPAAVTRVLAVEPEPALRAAALRAAGQAPVPVDVVDGLAEALPAGDGTFDAVVSCLVLCSVHDQAAVLREARRVLAPGGQLRFLEHVRAETPGIRRAQRVIDATLGPRLLGGCHCGRDTVAAIERAGLRVGRLDRFQFPGGRTPWSTHVLGSATIA